MTPRVTLRKALEDPELLGSALAGPTWHRIKEAPAKVATGASNQGVSEWPSIFAFMCFVSQCGGDARQSTFP
jgi:hypothetical protein